MSFWDDRVIEHHLVEDIRSAKIKIEEIDIEACDKDPAVLESKARLLAIVDRLQKRLAVVDPYFVPLQVLEDISQSLNAAVQCLDQFHATPEVAHLTLANVAADKILSQLSLLWFPRSAEDIEDLRLATANLRRTLEEHSRTLRTQLGEISAESSRLAADISDLRQEIAKQRSGVDSPSDGSRPYSPRPPEEEA